MPQYQVARNEDLAEQIGKDIYFDLVDHDKVRSFRIQKQTSFNIFKVPSLFLNEVNTHSDVISFG